jgi:hypothetical protein
MKSLHITLTTLIGLFLIFATPGEAKDYVLSIDGKDYEVEPGDNLTVRSKTGTDIAITFKKKEFNTFLKSDIFFEYPGNLSVASSDIETDIHQHLVASALGTILLIQNYDNISADGLTEVLFSALTKDDAKLKAKIDKQSFSRTLIDGTVVTGIKAHITNPTDDVTIEVLGSNRGDGGVVAVSRIDALIAANEQSIVDRFWATLKLK